MKYFMTSLFFVLGMSVSGGSIFAQGKQVEYGEYLSPGGQIFHGYRGYWMGSGSNPGFYLSGGTLIYTRNGGWAAGYGPSSSNYSNPASQGRLFKLIRGGWQQVSRVSDEGVYLQVNDEARNRTMHTSAYIEGRYQLSLPLGDRTFVPGNMIGMPEGLYEIVVNGTGLNINPVRR